MIRKNERSFMRTIKIVLQTLWISLLIGTSFTLTGCATRGDAIPQNSSTMLQVYEEAMQQPQGETLNQAREQVKNAATLPGINQNNNSVLTRTTENEIDNVFPLLPNPTLVMYVYPHFAGEEQLPVPGYSTAFPLYDKMYYAMPGEVVK